MSRMSERAAAAAAPAKMAPHDTPDAGSSSKSSTSAVVMPRAVMVVDMVSPRLLWAIDSPSGGRAALSVGAAAPRAPRSTAWRRVGHRRWRGSAASDAAALDAALAVGAELHGEGVEATLFEPGPHLPHQLDIEMQVVQARQHRRQHLAAAVEVMQVGARETRAGWAGASRIERRFVFLVAGVADAQVAEAGEQVPVPGVARRHDAIEHVDAGGDARSEEH